MKTRTWLTKDGFDYVSVTKETLDEALKLMKNTFFKHELVSTGLNLHKEPNSINELMVLCEDAALDGVSLIAIERSSGKVAGALFNKLITKTNEEKYYYNNFMSSFKSEASKAWAQFMIDADETCNLFMFHGIDCYLEIMFMAVLPDYRGKGIAKNFFQTSIKIATELKNGNNVKASVNGLELQLKPTPEAVGVLCTCIQTQKLTEHFGFVKNSIINFNKDWYNKGNNLDNKPNDEKLTIVLQSLKL